MLAAMSTLEIKATFSAAVLERAVRLLDTAAGSEPLNRYVLLYSEKALRMRATDGTLVVDFPIAGERPVEHAYVLPIDPLRHFLRGKKEEVELVVGKEVRLASEGETLVIRPVRKKKPPPLHKPPAASEISRSLLCSALDFSSAHLAQGDHMQMLVRDRELVCVGVSDSHVAGSKIPFGVHDSACFIVPYESVRHLVKVLGLIRRKTVMCAVSGEGVAISAGALGLCLYGAGCRQDTVQEIASFLFSHRCSSFWTVELSKIKKIISRAARIQRLAQAQAAITLGADRISVSVRHRESVFSSGTEPLYAENPRSFEIALRTDKLSSLLARLTYSRFPEGNGILQAEFDANGTLIRLGWPSPLALSCAGFGHTFFRMFLAAFTSALSTVEQFLHLHSPLLILLEGLYCPQTEHVSLVLCSSTSR